MASMISWPFPPAGMNPAVIKPVIHTEERRRPSACLSRKKFPPEIPEECGMLAFSWPAFVVEKGSQHG